MKPHKLGKHTKLCTCKSPQQKNVEQIHAELTLNLPPKNVIYIQICSKYTYEQIIFVINCVSNMVIAFIAILLLDTVGYVCLFIRTEHCKQNSVQAESSFQFSIIPRKQFSIGVTNMGFRQFFHLPWLMNKQLN